MAADTGPVSGPSTRLVAGRYALSEVIGRGGMGTVWLATDQVLEREVALKEVTFSVDLTEEERTVLRERTMREARCRRTRWRGSGSTSSPRWRPLTAPASSTAT